MSRFYRLNGLALLFLLFIPLCAFGGSGWIEKSNEVSKEFAIQQGERYPEGASSMGYRQFDAKGIYLEDNMETQDLAFFEKWRAQLQKKVEAAKDPDYRVDLKILLEYVKEQIQGISLTEKYAQIPFYPATQSVFGSLRSLINSQSNAKRKHAAVDRFKAYVNGQKKDQSAYKPLLEAYKSRIIFLEKKARENYPSVSLLYSLKNEMEQYLSDSAGYLKGIHELLQQSGRNDWSADYEKFRSQVSEYDSWVKADQVSKARTDYKLPKEIYSYLLQARGIHASPEELISIALEDYKKLYLQFEQVAKGLAKEMGLKNSSPVFILQRLKAHPLRKREELEKTYDEASAFLTQVIREKNLVSLPSTPLKIRLAGEAESKSTPVPHLKGPPLINNQGERPEFIIPTGGEGALVLDDFSYKAAAVVLTAHEGRPGHDLQFSTMLDHGASVIRAHYASNSVNCEGWGLYAEDLVFTSLPEESKLVALQFRLWRMARMFLDPQIQLGAITPEGVVRLLTQEVGLSKALAELEVRRYTFDDPGQAPSYYYGLKRLLALKSSLQAKSKAQFQERCFNDSILSLGLLPVNLIEERLETGLKCQKGSQRDSQRDSKKDSKRDNKKDKKNKA